MIVCVFVCNRVKRTLSARILSARRKHGTRGISMWGTRIWSPFTSKTHWSVRNQWKSSLPETGFSGVSRRGEDESETHTPRKPIGRPGTNGNRPDLKQAFLNNLDAGNMSPRLKHLETPSAGNQWKSTWSETSFSGASRCGKHESGVQTPWNNSRGPIILFEIVNNPTRS